MSSTILFRQTAVRHAAQATVATPQLPYFVPRNTNGNLPVYSDIRNNRTRYLVLIRNIDGHAHALAQDIRTSLFKSSSSKAARAKVEVAHSKHVVITGGRWKNEVIEWLKARGF